HIPGVRSKLSVCRGNGAEAWRSGEIAPKPLKRRCGNTGWDASILRIVPHARRQQLREGEEDAKVHAPAWAATREPGDLPDKTGAQAPKGLLLPTARRLSWLILKFPPRPVPIPIVSSRAFLPHFSARS